MFKMHSGRGAEAVYGENPLVSNRRAVHGSGGWFFAGVRTFPPPESSS